MSGSSYLTQINPNLQALGNEADLLYYESSQIKVQQIEANNRVGRYIRSIRQDFPGDDSVKIPNQDFIGSTYLQVELPPIKAGVSLPLGWLFYAIESLNYTVGSSNISLVTIRGIDLLHALYVDCETKEKRNYIMNLAGEMKEAATVDTEPRFANVLLKLPWSIISADDRKKLLDARLLDTNILVDIVWASKEKFFGYMDAEAGDVPDTFNSAKMIIKQTELTNKSDSLMTEMKKDPSLIYNYPFTHYQKGSTERFASTIGDVFVESELTGFLNSDLLGILFSVCDSKDITRANEAHGFINPFDLRKVKDIKLEYNGQIIAHYPGNLIDLATTNISMGDPSADLQKLITNTGVADVTSGLSHVYYIPMTQHKNLTFGEEYSNTSVYKSQPLNLSFTYTDTIADKNMVLRTTNLYNGFASIQDMTSKLHFG